MIQRRQFIAIEETLIDEGIRHAVNALGAWAERRNITLHSEANMGVDLCFRIKAAIMLCLSEVTQPQVDDEAFDPRGKPKAKPGPKAQGDPSRPIGRRRSTDLLSEELK